MESALPKHDVELRKASELIPTMKPFSKPVMDIAKLISTCMLTTETIQEVLDTHKIERISELKLELLDLLIAYANVILDDQIVSESERFNIEILKKYFKIREGDFYAYRYSDVEKIRECNLNCVSF